MENFWVTFDFEGNFHIGRVLREEGALFISSVSEHGVCSLIPYKEVPNLKRLKILREHSDSKEKTNEINLHYKFNEN